MARISNNLCTDYFHHQKVKNKSQQNIIEYGKSHFYDPETKADFEMLRSRIREVANQELPEKWRKIFFLSRIENKRNSELVTHYLPYSTQIIRLIDHSIITYQIIWKTLSPLFIFKICLHSKICLLCNQVFELQSLI